MTVATIRELDTPGKAKFNGQMATLQRQRNAAQNREAHLAGLVAGLEITINEKNAEIATKDKLIAQLNGTIEALKQHANRQAEELFALRGPEQKPPENLAGSETVVPG
jgi:chromosome segregation ATPase